MAVKQIVPTEHEEQVRIISWCNLMSDRGEGPYDRIFAIPNGGAREKATAGKLKAEGVKAGVPDMMLPIPKGVYAGLFIELKRRKGGTVSAEQKDWGAFLQGQSYKYIVARGSDEAMTMIKAYMELKAGETL